MQNFTAYIDAATMTMVFSAGAAVVVSVGTALAVYFRRAKKKISDKLGIDENQNKVMEADLTGSFGENKDN